MYCFARPSHAYLDLSPGLDFETRLFAKTNAAELLRAELGKPGYVPKPIALGINTDGWQPIERDHGISRACLRLPHELKQVWREWLQLHYPQRAEHVMSLIQQMRGGKDYDSAFGTRMRGQGPFAELVAMRFGKTRKRLAFPGMPALRTDLFIAPKRESPQGTLF